MTGKQNYMIGVILRYGVLTEEEKTRWRRAYYQYMYKLWMLDFEYDQYECPASIVFFINQHIDEAMARMQEDRFERKVKASRRFRHWCLADTEYYPVTEGALDIE